MSLVSHGTEHSELYLSRGKARYLAAEGIHQTAPAYETLQSTPIVSKVMGMAAARRNI